ncbi:MAG: MucR family transcriptional regulator [Janthinobacterium lividum]
MTDENLDASTHDTGPASMLALTAQIVAAYTRKNSMPGSELPALIDRVFQSLAGLATGSVTPAPQVRPEPAVPVKKSVFADHIVCLEDGKKMKMLKRHLMTSYGLTPQAYRERWGLPSDYPMVAPSYAEKRSTLAKSIGLGRKPAGAAAAEVAPEEEQVTPIPKTWGRKLAKAAEAHEE